MGQLAILRGDEKMILESANVDLPKLSRWFRRSFLRKWGTVIPIAFPSLLGLCLSTPPTPKKILTRNCQVKSCRLSLKSCQRQRISTSFPRFFVLWTNPPMTIPSLEKFWLFFYCQCEGFPSSSISANPRLHKFAIPFSGSFFVGRLTLWKFGIFADQERKFILQLHQLKSWGTIKADARSLGMMMRRCDGGPNSLRLLGAINDSETLLNKDIILHPIEKLVSTEKLIEYLSEKYIVDIILQQHSCSSSQFF